MCLFTRVSGAICKTHCGLGVMILISFAKQGQTIFSPSRAVSQSPKAQLRLLELATYCALQTLCLLKSNKPTRLSGNGSIPGNWGRLFVSCHCFLTRTSRESEVTNRSFLAESHSLQATRGQKLVKRSKFLTEQLYLRAQQACTPRKFRKPIT